MDRIEQKICDIIESRKDEIMAFGDAQNDIQMIEQVGIGVAMGNAMEEVKAVADYVADTNLDNGIGKTIDLLLAGKEMDLRRSKR